MIENLTVQQFLLFILGIIILLWLIYWICSSSKKNKVAIYQPYKILSHQQNVKSSNQLPIQHQETPFILYYFYIPTCGFCKQFTPSWIEVVNKLKNLNIVTLRAIDATKPENETLAFYYNISHSPTVILVTPDKNIEYDGNRDPNDLYNFVVSNINEYSQNIQHVPNNQFDINNQYATING